MAELILGTQTLCNKIFRGLYTNECPDLNGTVQFDNSTVAYTE